MHNNFLILCTYLILLNGFDEEYINLRKIRLCYCTQSAIPKDFEISENPKPVILNSLIVIPDYFSGFYLKILSDNFFGSLIGIVGITQDFSFSLIINHLIKIEILYGRHEVFNLSQKSCRKSSLIRMYQH